MIGSLPFALCRSYFRIIMRIHRRTAFQQCLQFCGKLFRLAAAQIPYCVDEGFPPETGSAEKPPLSVSRYWLSVLCSWNVVVLLSGV